MSGGEVGRRGIVGLGIERWRKVWESGRVGLGWMGV